jgi:regulator of replication initiation timing
MPAEDYFTPTDLNALRMENELLTLENTFLKGRIRTLEQNLRQARSDEKQAQAALTRARQPPKPTSP